jgi:hypothetical protein
VQVSGIAKRPYEGSRGCRGYVHGGVEVGLRVPVLAAVARAQRVGAPFTDLAQHRVLVFGGASFDGAREGFRGEVVRQLVA